MKLPTMVVTLPAAVPCPRKLITLHNESRPATAARPGLKVLGWTSCKATSRYAYHRHNAGVLRALKARARKAAQAPAQAPAGSDRKQAAPAVRAASPQPPPPRRRSWFHRVFGFGS